MSSREKTALSILSVLFVLAGGPVQASIWCGHNGTVVLSFGCVEELQSELHAAEAEGHPLFVDIYAVMSDVDPISYQGERIMGLGGFEARLVVEGAEGTIIAKDYDYRRLDMGQSLDVCRVGVVPALNIAGGPALLVHWKVMFDSTPGPVTFHLDPSGTPSCETVGGCDPETNCVLYTGSADTGQNGLLFGASYVPAFLNWEEKPDLSPRGVGKGWQDTGLCQAAE